MQQLVDASLSVESAQRDARPWVRRWAPLGLALGVFGIDVLLNRVARGDYAAGVMHIVPLLMSLWVRPTERRMPIHALVQVLNLALLPILGVTYHTGAWYSFWNGFGLESHEIVDRLFIAFALWVTRELALRRLEIEQHLAHEREFTRTTLHSIDDAVLAADAHGRVNFVNPRAERLLGRPRAELLGEPLASVLDLHVRERGLDVPQDPGKLQNTHWLRRSALGDLPIDHSRAPIRDHDGNLRGEVLVLRDASERVRHADAMRKLAYRDELTDLPNRLTLFDRLTLELEHARRQDSRLGVLYIDLDGFKQVNDNHGHRAGDALLKTIAQALRGALRRGDTIARLGGDEFTILLPRLADREDARGVACKVLEAVRDPIVFEGVVLRCSASMGVALYPEHATSADLLMKLADEAMYRAKTIGSALCFHGGQPEALLAREPSAPRTPAGSATPANASAIDTTASAPNATDAIASRVAPRDAAADARGQTPR